MGISNTTSFSLQDVVTDLGGGETSLQECFDNAHTEGFDATYNQDSYAPANSLLRFRNYNYVAYNNHVIYTHPAILETVSFSTYSTGGIISRDGEPDKTISSGSGRSTHIFYVAPAEIELTHVYANNLTSINHTFAASFTNIDISGAPDLETLSSVSGILTTLDTSSNPSIRELYLDDNNITSLDLSNNPALTLLSLYRNELVTLDISNNPAINNMRASSTLSTETENHILLTLDANGLSNGTLDGIYNHAGLSPEASAARLNLINKGWTLT